LTKANMAGLSNIRLRLGRSPHNIPRPLGRGS